MFVNFVGKQLRGKRATNINLTRGIEMKVIIWLLYGTVVIYSMLDGVQTVMLLSVGAKEINPLLSWAMELTGTVYVMFYIKTGALVALLILLMIYLKNDHKEFEHVK